MDRIVRAGAAGPDAVEPMALANRYLARRDLDSRWSRSHARRFVRRNFDATRNPRIDRHAGWRERDFLPGGRSAWRAPFWLRDRPSGTKEIVFHHGRGLSRRHRPDCVFVEFRA